MAAGLLSWFWEQMGSRAAPQGVTSPKPHLFSQGERHQVANVVTARAGLRGVLPSFLQAVDEALFDDGADVAVDAANSR